MSFGDWLGLISLALAIPLGVASSLLTTRLVSYLERRKLVKTHRTREQELAAYKRIEAFKTGTRDKYPAYLLLSVGAVIFAIGFATILLLLALRFGRFFEGTALPTPATINLSALAFACFVLCIAFMGGIVNTARRIEHFEQYKEEIRKKWGGDAI